MHSLFHIPCKRYYSTLISSSTEYLALKHANEIIDEMSMLTANTLYEIMKRIHEVNSHGTLEDALTSVKCA